jgi:DNA polymerase
MNRETSPKPRRSPRQGTPAERVLAAARREAADCRACPLWKNATQTVFGEGKARALVMMVGEQPGDREDLAGRPFVGPAGRLLDRALLDAGIERDRIYVTNAVKHFKNEPRGKRRIHKKPSDREIEACYQWLEREIDAVAPSLIIALGATAVRALLGQATPVERNRGRLIRMTPGTQLLITVHPSMLLRLPQEYKADAYRAFVKNLKLAAPFTRR